MATVTLHLPFPPSVNGLYRNSVGRGKRGRLLTSAHLAWRNEAGKEVMLQRIGQPRITGPYALTLVIGRPQDKRQRDLANLEKAVSDLLVQMQIVRDDSDAQQIVLRWGAEPGCHVTIEDFHENVMDGPGNHLVDVAARG